MRRLLSSVVIVTLTTSLLAAPAPVETEARARKKREKAAREHVEKMFDAMRAGRYEDVGFPRLRWEHVPALLERAPSGRSLNSFPQTFLSSTILFECKEGVMALWLIEGIRKGGKFPSLHPILRDPMWPGPGEPDAELLHARFLAAYRAWWKKVKDLPPAKAAAIEPLADTGLKWF